MMSSNGASRKGQSEMTCVSACMSAFALSLLKNSRPVFGQFAPVSAARAMFVASEKRTLTL